MDHDASTNDWNLDRIIIHPGHALEYIKTFQRRERDLLEANNRYLERARTAEAEPVAVKKSVEDYALSVTGGLAGYFGKVSRVGPETQAQADARWCFDAAQAMVAERDKRGL